MLLSKEFTAEGGELLLQSVEGHFVLIPSKYRHEVLDMINSGCDACINNLIKSLPIWDVDTNTVQDTSTPTKS